MEHSKSIDNIRDVHGSALNGGFHLAKKIKKHKGQGIFLSGISGESTPDALPFSARAVIKANDRGIYAQIRELATSSFSGYIKCKGIGQSLEITAFSSDVQTESATEELNSILLLIHFLSNIDFSDDDTRDFLDFFTAYVSSYNIRGQLHPVQSDFDFTINIFKIEFQQELLMLSGQLSSNASISPQQAYAHMLPLLTKYGLGIIKDVHRSDS